MARDTRHTLAMIVAPTPAVRLFPLSSVRLTGGHLYAAQETNRQYLHALDPDRLLAPILREAGLEPRAAPYGNWESLGLDGHTAGHYLSALALHTASTGDRVSRDRLVYAVAELRRAQCHTGTGYIGGIPRGAELWAEVAQGITERTFTRDGRWVPWYNLHKLYAGLFDAHRHAGVEGALEVLLGLADWWEKLAAGIDDEHFQLMLVTEFGGMNDAYALLYELTGDERHAAMARRFTRRALLGPLAATSDELTGLHANTQIPQINGFHRLGVLTGDATLMRAASFFWDTVTARRSVAIGGNSVREHFHDPGDFTPMVEDREGPETCNTYNLLKLSAALYEATDEVRYIDYYERALFNQILSAQHPDHGGFVYFTSMRPGHYRTYSTVENCFWCCVGTGLESHAMHATALYAHQPDTLTVLQYSPSTVRWDGHGVVLQQHTTFPDQGKVILSLVVDEPHAFTLRVRRPSWAMPASTVRVNGEPAAPVGAVDSYVVLRRRWRTGDTITLDFAMAARLERFPDGSPWASVLHGPTVLARRGPELSAAVTLAGPGRIGHIATGPLEPLACAPVLTPDAIASMTRSGDAFSVDSADGPIRLVPFRDLHDSRYTVCFPLAEGNGIEERRRGLVEQDHHSLSLDGRTVDSVALGEQQPETDHGFTGDGETGSSDGIRWRSTTSSFEVVLHDYLHLATLLRISALRSTVAACFRVLVDGNVIHTIVMEPSDGSDMRQEWDLVLPPVQGERSTRIIRIETLPGAFSGRLTELRLLT